MILTCPSCSTRYLSDPASFHPSGRMVRCANCGHSWFQKPSDDMPKKVAGADSPVSGGLDPMTRLPRNPHGSRGRRFNLPIPPSNIALWFLLAVAVFGFGTIFYQYRLEIVRGWPQTASLYKLIGVDVNSVGIIFRDVSKDLETQESVSVLVVRGTLVNITDHDIPIPRVRINLRDEEAEELYHWTVVLPQTRLEAGASIEFVTSLSSPPVGTHDLEVRFAEDTE